MDIRQVAPAVLVAAALTAGAGNATGWGSPASSTPATRAHAPSSRGRAVLKTANIRGVRVLTNSRGFTLYWFAPDTSTASRCNGVCAQVWPPVKGPAAAGRGVTGRLRTIRRSGGRLQATYNGHPLYSYTADTAPGQAVGNGVNSFGGLWHEVTVSG